MLWVCLHFPQLALDVFSPPPDMPLVVEEVSRQRREVLLASPAALAAGVRPGMNIPSAYGLCDQLQVKVRDETLEQKALQRVALLSYQFTPHIAVCPPDSLLLELESSLRLFGGCQALLECLQASLAEEGLQYTLACFPTAKGAVVLARCQVEINEARIFPMEALHTCPLTATDIPVTQVERLAGMGLTTLGQLFHLPSAALGKRLGQGTLFYLQQLRGLQADLRPLYLLPPEFSSRLELGHETSQQTALLFPLKRLLGALENYLCARQLLAASIVLSLKRRDLSEETLTLAPTQGLLKADEMLSLFSLRLEQHPLTQPVLGIGIEARDFYALKPLNGDLFAPAGQQLTPQALVDRLQARLGIERVSGVRLVEDYRPERAWQSITPGKTTSNAMPPLVRPLWLFEAPHRLRSKKGFPCEGDTPLALLQGPERIDTGWWDQYPLQRDYYVAQHPKGALYWIFRPVPQPDQWFLHGVFS